MGKKLAGMYGFQFLVDSSARLVTFTKAGHGNYALVFGHPDYGDKWMTYVIVCQEYHDLGPFQRTVLLDYFGLNFEPVSHTPPQVLAREAPRDLALRRKALESMHRLVSMSWCSTLGDKADPLTEYGQRSKQRILTAERTLPAPQKIAQLLATPTSSAQTSE